MKKYINYISENIDDNNLIIHNLSYYDIINICELENLEINKSYEDSNNMGYCDYIKQFIEHPSLFKNTNYRFLIGIKNKKLASLFYKVINTQPNQYGDGYIISTEKGSANKMFLEMKKEGSFTTFSNLDNIPSIKAQLKIGAEILALSSNAPDKYKASENYNISIDNNIIELMKEKEIYYKDTYTNNEFFFLDKNNEINLNKIENFLLNNSNIKLFYPQDKFIEEDGKVNIKLKLYFYHKKI